MSRGRAVLAVAAVLAPALFGATVSTTVTAAVSTAHGSVRGDFNGDGYADLAVGIPNGNGGVGAVMVLYGSASGLTTTGSQYWTLGMRGLAGPRGAAGDAVGSSLATGDFNRSGFADLAIGAPGARGVLVLYGSRQGLQAAGSQFLQGSASSGYSLAAGDFNGDGIDDLAVGQPFAMRQQAGSVEVHYGSRYGLGNAARGTAQAWSEGSPGVPSPDLKHDFDNFGLALASGHFRGQRFADLAIGVPNSQQHGATYVLNGSPRGLTAAGSQYLEGYALFGASGAALAAGDFNGDGFDDLAVASPDTETSTADAGALEIHYGSATGLRQVRQGAAKAFAEASVGMPGPPTAPSDKFGYSLAAGDFNGDGLGDLAVGVAGKSAAIVLYGSMSGLTVHASQYLAGIGPQSTSQYSQEAVSLAAGDFKGNGWSDLVLGEPLTATSQAAAGIIEVYPGSQTGVQDVAVGTAPRFAEGDAGMAGPPPASYDYFGAAAAAAGSG